MKQIEGHLDLFSGIGGFSLALERSGVHPDWIGFSDIDKYANKLFKRRFPNAKRLGSVTDVSYKSIGRRISLLTGGFPCQSFSLAGKRGGFEDTRGTLFFEIARILREYRDKGTPIPNFVLENVKGLYSSGDYSAFPTIYGVLTDLGYTVEVQLLNTRWFLPQNRERVYFVGHFGKPSGKKIFPIQENGRGNKKIKFPREEASRSKEGLQDNKSRGGCSSNRSIEVISKKGVKKNNQEYASCLAGGGHSGGNHSDMDLLQIKSAAIRGREDNSKGNLEVRKDDVANTIINSQNASLVLNENKVVKKDYKILDDYNNKIKEDGLCGAITQHCSRSARKNGMKVVENNTSIRRLTPIECERLQGFPDNWTSGQSDTQRYKQCGNAITVDVAAEIFRRLYNDN